MSTIRGKVISIETDGAGAFATDVRVYGKIHALALRLGDLVTPDLTVEDYLSGAPVLAVTGVAASKRWQPRVLVQDEDGADIAATYDAPFATGRLSVVVAGGGATKSGELVIVFEG